MTSNQLDLIAEQVRGCQLCKLHACRLNAVAGGPNPRARIMVIGEGPGRNEDETGQPFVGMAGRFLDTLFARAGLSREDVFITNVVKCRPPENRAPEPDEVAACAPYLTAQIAAVDPLLIILLGGTAAKAVLGLKQIAADHGKLMERDGRNYFVAYHPAARFHRKKIAEDFDNLKLVLPSIAGLNVG